MSEETPEATAPVDDEETGAAEAEDESGGEEEAAGEPEAEAG